jgi:tetratricopeptide (TPR) repeat protein
LRFGLLCTILLLTGSGLAADLSVCPNDCDFTRITDAVMASTAGDTIRVYSGLYKQNIETNKYINLYLFDTGDGIRSGNIILSNGTAIRVKLPRQETEILDHPAAYWLEKANESFIKGSYEESLDYYNKSLWVYPLNQRAWIARAATLMKLERHNEALDNLDQVIQWDPSLAEAWNEKGNCLYHIGKYDDALMCYKKGVQLEPKYADAWSGMGKSMMALGNMEKADEYYASARKLGYNS